MKVVVKILAIFLLVAGLAQLIDLSFYLMNQSDTYVFYLGLISFAATFVAFGFLGVYAVKFVRLEEEKEDKQNKKEEL